jgi:hypothetical protein
LFERSVAVVQLDWCGAQVSQERPKSWANWRAYLDGKQARSAHEFDLYSDSVIHGTARDFGPYRVMNLVAGERRETALARPVMTLRIRYATNPNSEDEDADHGKRHPDEMSALIALVLGIRLQAGGQTRYFDFGDNGEPLGNPRAQAEVQTPLMLQGAWSEIIAHARRTADLDELSLLDTYPQLDAAVATALIRSARLYQEALWISEREPWLAWLLLVSAVEVVANAHKHGGEASPVDLLREFDPRLADVAQKYGDACVHDVAATQVKLLGATKKFLGFLQTFMPDPPENRPTEYRVDWTWGGLIGLLKQIYRMRSEYLHAGVPFPWQLRGAPESHESIPTERHPDHIEEARQRDGKRLCDADLPMHVHVFEYIVRGALVRWWQSVVPTATLSVDLG